MTDTTPLPLSLALFRGDGLIALENTTAAAPAGVAALDIGDVCSTVSLTNPEVPVQISTLTMADGHPDANAVNLLRLLAGNEAAELAASEPPDGEDQILWLPVDGSAWTTIGRLAYLTHLSTVEGTGSPW